LESAKAELATQADAARDLIKRHEKSIESLDSQVRERQGEINRLEALLKWEIAERQRELAQAKSLEKQAAELTSQLAENTAEQQRRQQHELELEQCICRQKDQLADSAAAATSQEVTEEAEFHW
jgi:hypothetical protein